MTNAKPQWTVRSRSYYERADKLTLGTALSLMQHILIEAGKSPLTKAGDPFELARHRTKQSLVRECLRLDREIAKL